MGAFRFLSGISRFQTIALASKRSIHAGFPDISNVIEFASKPHVEVKITKYFYTPCLIACWFRLSNAIQQSFCFVWITSVLDRVSRGIWDHVIYSKVTQLSYIGLLCVVFPASQMLTTVAREPPTSFSVPVMLVSQSSFL